MGNCPSYCLAYSRCCCCSCCKDKNVNLTSEDITTSSVSVITEQPSLSGNNSEPVNKSPSPQEHKAINEVSNNERNIRDNLEISRKERKIKVKKDCKTVLIENGELVKKASLRRKPSNVSSNLKYAEKKSLDLNAFVTESLRRKSSDKKYKEIIEKIKKLTILKDTQPQKVIKNPEILIKLLHLKVGIEEFANFADPILNHPNKIYTVKQLDKNSSDYKSVSNCFTSTNKRFYNIQKIEKIFNPYLLLQYKLKHLEYLAKKAKVKECMMFHGTSKTNLKNICQDNFDWRLNGRKLGSRNGQGVNFASNAYYSTHYGDTGFNKVMILAKVLIGKSCQGSTTVSVPTGDVDTTTDHRQPPQVYVKYDDNTFYPLYIIYYGGIDPKYSNRGLRRGRGRGRGRGSFSGRRIYNR